MRREILYQLSTTSTIAEVPGHHHALEGSSRARHLAELFHDLPELPGVLLTEHGQVYSAVSRRYYLEMVGSYCGKDLYLSRPIRLMMDNFEKLGGALSVAAGLPIRDAVERGLSRPRDLIYEPLIVRLAGEAASVGEARLVDFEDLLIADSRLSFLRNRQMGQILGTVGEGLLLIQPDRRIAAEYSRSAEALLATGRIADRRLDELLADRLDPETRRLAAEFVDILFRPSVIEALVAKLNPLATVELRSSGEARPRILTFRFARHLEGQTVRYLLVRIEDITKSEEQARELARQQETSELRLSLAVALAEAEPAMLTHFLEALDRQRQAVRALASGAGPEAPARVEALARELHALKGEAGLLGLQPFRGALHELEDRLGRPANAANPSRSGPALNAPLDRLDALCREARMLISRFRRFGAAKKVEEAPAALFSRTARHIDELAAELGKQARFVHRVADGTIPAAFLPWLQEALAQLATNALVHGIEAPERRVAAGKAATGTLLLAVRHHPASGRLEVVFQDDGAGLDLERIRSRAQALGLAAASEGELAHLVFRPGFSTLGRASEHAGRGVGLDVVRARVEARGGKVAIFTEPGKFCAIRMLLPASIEVAA